MINSTENLVMKEKKKINLNRFLDKFSARITIFISFDSELIVLFFSFSLMHTN